MYDPSYQDAAGRSIPTGTNSKPTITFTPVDAWLVSASLADEPTSGRLDAASPSIRPFLDHIQALPAGDRVAAWKAFRLALADAAVRMVDDSDPAGPPPTVAAGAVIRSAHTGDLAAAAASNRFAWPGWLIRGHVNLLSSDPKIGKTHLVLDLARRLWHGMEWPDGQIATFPAGTMTLWIPGDRHQDEIRERAGAFGLPPEAVRFNATPSEPYSGWNLDDPDSIDRLRALVTAERPGLVIIDTLWRATRRKLRQEEECNALMEPILDIAQTTDTAIVALMHLSKDGETLGRRMEGLARSILKLTRPDPDGQPDRRRLDCTGNFKESPSLGVTVHDSGCDYDHSPPSTGFGSQGGRPAAARTKAEQFIVGMLANQDETQVKILDDWLTAGNPSKNPIFDAIRALTADGRIVIDDSRKPKVVHLVKQPAP